MTSPATTPRYSIAKHRPAPSPVPTPTRTAAPRLKVVIRRLPPGLTEQEFYEALGKAAWDAGGERTIWASYREGKISKDPAKPSKPSRAYFQLSKPEHLTALSDRVRETTFIDAKASGSDPALLGPPTVEFAPYGRLPHSRPRKDARQGTIDQDPEFIGFLESLTNPIPRPALVEVDNGEESKKNETKMVTPLIQSLRDKKANKGKEPPVVVKSTKHSRQDSKDSKTSQGSDKKTTTKAGKDSPTPVEKRSANAARLEKVARDAARVATQQAKNMSKVASTPVPTSPVVAKSQPQPSTPVVPPERKRERGNASGVARILQRDLGLGGPPSGRRRRDVPSSPAKNIPGSSATIPVPTVSESPKATPVTTSSTTTPATETPLAIATTTSTPAVTSKTSNVAPPTGPASTRSNINPRPPPTKPATSSVKPPQQPKQPTPAPTSTQAFLKHANPSQGITEPLLHDAFSKFGPLTSVTIDTKKGFAYVDFAAPEGLQKAMAASPVKVAQGQVVVLERKVGGSSAGANRGGRGGATVGRGTPVAMRGGRGGSVRGGRGGGRPGLAATAAKPVAETGGALAPSAPAQTAGSAAVEPKPAQSPAALAAATTST